MHKWIFNEYKHCGVDYSNVKQAEIYDNQHQKFRDYEQEFINMLKFLELENTQDLTIVDLGCGTGATSVYAAEKFRKVFAVDVSEVMLEQAKRKIAYEHIDNVEFSNAGFLSYKHDAEQADIVMTKTAFHHLPDFWKQIGLLRMNQMLKLDGILYIHDVVFHFEPTNYIGKISNWISGLEKVAGAEFKAEVETHIRDEFSTFNWILEGMLTKAGFIIEKCRTSDEFITEYVCKKVKEIFIETDV